MSKSKLYCIKCEVPQGSILGPLLHLIYVNDILYSTHSNILSLADDTYVTLVQKLKLDSDFREAKVSMNPLGAMNGFVQTSYHLMPLKQSTLLYEPNTLIATSQD